MSVPGPSTCHLPFGFGRNSSRVNAARGSGDKPTASSDGAVSLGADGAWK
jgi:hypothetical protein